MPKDFKERIKASVPLLVDMQYLAPINFAKSNSNFATYSPSVKSVLAIRPFQLLIILFVFEGLNSSGK